MTKKTRKNHLRLSIILTLVVVGLAIVAYYFITNLLNKPSTGSTLKTCTTYNNRVLEKCRKDYLGLTERSAVKLAQEQGYTPHIQRIPKKIKPGTDYGNFGTPQKDNHNIIYLVIQGDKVVNIYFPEAGKAE